MHRHSHEPECFLEEEEAAVCESVHDGDVGEEGDARHKRIDALVLDVA